MALTRQWLKFGVIWCLVRPVRARGFISRALACSRNDSETSKHQVDSHHSHRSAPRRLYLSAPLWSSERRKLKARTVERFQLSPEFGDTLVPNCILPQRFSSTMASLV